MKFTYTGHYAIPYPYLDEPETVAKEFAPGFIFLPDQVLAAMEHAIRSRIKSYQQCYRQDVAGGKLPCLIQESEDEERIVIPGPAVESDDCKAMAEQTIKLIDSDWVLPKSDIDYEGTINDPIRLIYETGFYKSVKASSKKKKSQTQNACAEVQGFFCQHAFYDSELRPDRSPELSQAVALHKKAETLAIIDRLDKGFAALDLIHSFQGEERSSNAGQEKLDDAWEFLHDNPQAPGWFIAAGLWELFKAMSEGEKKVLLSVLFPEKKGSATLESILTGIGIIDQNGLDSFLKKAAGHLLI